VAGEIDAHSVVKLRAVLDDLGLDKQVVIDMSAVSFIDSSVLSALVDHSLRIEGSGKTLRITKPSRRVSRVLEITGLSHMSYELQNQ
jgi:anti-anti-sigma factor